VQRQMSIEAFCDRKEKTIRPLSLALPCYLLPLRSRRPCATWLSGDQ
jgi:hypothetical protein